MICKYFPPFQGALEFHWWFLLRYRSFLVYGCFRTTIKWVPGVESAINYVSFGLFIFQSFPQKWGFNMKIWFFKLLFSKHQNSNTGFGFPHSNQLWLRSEVTDSSLARGSTLFLTIFPPAVYINLWSLLAFMLITSLAHQWLWPKREIYWC